MSLLRPDLNNKEHLKTKFLNEKINNNLDSLFNYESKDDNSENCKKSYKLLFKKYKYVDNFIKNYFRFIDCVNNTADGYTTDENSSDEEEYFDGYLSN